MTQIIWKFKFKPPLTITNKKIYLYQSKGPLPVKGFSKVNVAANQNSVNAKLYIVQGLSGSILSKITAEQLNLLRDGPPVAKPPDGTVAAINETLKVLHPSTQQIIDKYHNVFHGSGLRKDFELQLHIDPQVTPVQQPIQRVPYHTHQKVEAELDCLQRLDSKEPAQGLTTWLNPFISVPKTDGSIRFCLDMRRVNDAVTRKRYTIPKLDDILPELHGSKYFSKIDLREGYYQILLHPKSRPITSFATHKGLSQYKRLI